MAKWVPGKDRLLVRRHAAVTETPLGLIIPDSLAQAERPFRGEVLAVGETDRPVHSGYEVYYSRFGGVELALGDFSKDGKEETLIVLHVDEILLLSK